MLMRKRNLGVVLLLAALAAAQQGSPAHLDVPFVPSPNEVVEGMLKLANVKSTDTVYDLGCGDGRIVIAAAKNYKAHGVGVDIDPARIQEARENAKQAGVANLVRFEQNDLFKADIRNATVVTLYLLPNVNERLKPRLLSELKPGTRVVSHSFDMGEWKPDREETIDGRSIYLWTVPAKKR
jgi:SAM-dependent methyltransferase